MASPKTITPSRTWAPVDVQPLCKVWETTKGGSEVRQNNSALVAQALAGAANHTFAYMPRVIFARGWPFGNRQDGSEDPLVIWRYIDDVANGRDVSCRILHIPKGSGTTDGYAFRYTASSTKTADTNLNVSSPSYPVDLHEAQYEYTRGAADGSAIEEGVSTSDYSISDIVVQDQPTPHLNYDQHLFASASGVAPGRPVVANWVNQLRFDWHQHRTTNLPIWSVWSGVKDSSAWTTPGGTDKTAIVSVSTTLTNVMDGSTTSRTAASPGSRHNAYKMGRGLSTKYPVCFYAYADATDTGTLRGIGPDHVASNQADLAIDSTGPKWYGPSDTFYLNTAVDPTDTTTARNKIDWLLNHSAANTTYVYAICLVGLYEE